MKTKGSIRLMTSNVLGNWRDGFIENRDDVMADTLTAAVCRAPMPT